VVDHLLPAGYQLGYNLLRVNLINRRILTPGQQMLVLEVPQDGRKSPTDWIAFPHYNITFVIALYLTITGTCKS